MMTTVFARSKALLFAGLIIAAPVFAEQTGTNGAKPTEQTGTNLKGVSHPGEQTGTNHGAAVGHTSHGTLKNKTECAAAASVFDTDCY